MSDLCYNCACCHLTAGPCLRDLVQCEICYSWGHLYIFCPRSVIIKDRDYKYWALCHNCDGWHLPAPCPKPYHLCGQCGHTGHLEFFCPVAPTDRTAYLREQYRLQIPGQQPVNHDFRLPFKGDIPEGTITRIKFETVRDAFKLLDEGWSPQDVLEHTVGPPRVMQPVLMPPGNEGTVLGQLPIVGQVAPVARFPQNSSAQPTALNTTQTSADQLEHKSQIGPYAKMHQRFHQGDLAKSIEQERPMDTMPMTPTPSKAPRVPRAILPATQVTTPIMQNKIRNTRTIGHETNNVDQKLQDNEAEQQAIPTIEATDNVTKPGKKEKPKKAIKTEREATPGGSALKQGPRCAKCIKSHKRCTHRVQQSPTPRPGPDGMFGTFSVAASATPESHTSAPQPVPDLSLNQHAAPMPTPFAFEKAAGTKRKR